MNHNNTWEQLWSMLEPDEQQQAIDLFWDQAHTRPDLLSLRDHLLVTLARTLNFRPQTLRTKDRRWVAAHLVRQRVRLFDHATWSHVFTGFYANHRSPMTCAFLDILGIAHDEYGLVDGHPDVPAASALADAARPLLQTHPEGQVRHYLAVLEALDLPLWVNTGEAQTLLQGAAQPEVPEAGVDPDVAPSDAAGTNAPQLQPDARPCRGTPDGFTTLGHLLTEQVTASVA